jgi:integrase/recombinase XerD
VEVGRMSSEAAGMEHRDLGNLDLIEEFYQDCELRDMTPETIRRYKSSILIFNEFLVQRGIPLVAVDKGTLKDFLGYLRQERKVKQKTIENYFSALSSIYEFLEFEDYILKNPVLAVRKRFLRSYKKDGRSDSERKLISVEEMKILINSVLDARDKAIITLFAKTGIRRGELITIDVDDINWIENSITLKPKRKRSNRVVFFDDETARILKRWLRIRDQREPLSNALFINEVGNRLDRNGVYTVVTKHAQRVDLHHPESDRMEDHFCPHCCRHWFTTHLRRAWMKREFRQELRGDARRDAIDIYDHIDKEELREAYLAHIPQLGI